MTRLTIHEDEGYCSKCVRVYKLVEARTVISKLGFTMYLCKYHGKQLRRNYKNSKKKLRTYIDLDKEEMK